MLPDQLKTILDKHKDYLNGNSTGVRANLHGADLRGANLYGADLRGADLRGANLRGADLYGANLYGADLYGADLYGANLRGADLRGVKSSFLILKNVSGLAWDILMKDDLVKVGCQEHTYSQWLNFSHKEISEMAANALEFYPLLLNILEYSYQGTKFAITKDLK